MIIQEQVKLLNDYSGTSKNTDMIIQEQVKLLAMIIQEQVDY